jgi:hypothetical protein
LEELPNKIKGMVRNARRAEAEIAALKISYLKRIGKGSNIVIMDSSVHRNLFLKMNAFVSEDELSELLLTRLPLQNAGIATAPRSWPRRSTA